MIGLEEEKGHLKIEIIPSSFSKVECQSDIGKLKDCIKKHLGNRLMTIICWQYHRIIWGRWIDERIILSDGSELKAEDIEEIRIFDEKAELRLLKDSEMFCGRLVRDGEGDSIKYVDSLSRLWGKSSGVRDGYIRLVDANRKLEMTIPCEETAGNYYALVTRNYIGVHEKTAQAGYVDYRYVGIVPLKEG